MAIPSKRKHIRVTHEKEVICVSRGEAFAGNSINMSRSGMQVMVTLPATHRDVERITFTLPHTDKPLELPCHVVRIVPGKDGGQLCVLGVEFNYHTEAQMILIDNYIRDMKEIRLMQKSNSEEIRQIPRMPCWITGIVTDKKNVVIKSIDNISAEGLLMSYEGMLSAQDELSLCFNLPGHPKKIQLTGKVMYGLENIFTSVNTAGILFTRILEIERIKISNFLIEYASSSAMRTIQNKFLTHEINKEYKITESKKIGTILAVLKNEKAAVNILFEKSHKMFEILIQDLINKKKLLLLARTPELQAIHLQKEDAVYVSFYLKGSNYYFKTEIRDVSSDYIFCRLPELLYRSEKRSYQRKFLADGNEFYLSCDGTSDGQMKGKIIEISRRGFLCEIPYNPSHRTLLKSGHTLRYFIKHELGLDSQGEIRHLTKEIKESGETVLRIGVEAGIRRKPFTFSKYSAAQWHKQKVYGRIATAEKETDIKSLVVEYHNKEHKKISGLINYTRKHAIAPVVLLPPAFGKKKETLSPLAVTLLANFRHLGKDIITLRYDGINRPGESYNDEMCPRRGYEMLHYRMSQGLDDLRTTLEYVYNNPYFFPERVVLLAFSMSSLDARKLVLEQKEKKIDFLINVMGVTCGQSALSNITGGLDIIGNYKIGIANGVSGLLGHLIDLDNLAEDIIKHKYAFLTDTRQDMSQIGIPVLWIYGKYDRWIPVEEIKDIMSISAPGERQVVEIPTGHNLRSSEDAIRTFKLIAQVIYQELYKKTMRTVDPCRDTVVKLITYERERLSASEDFNADAYWKEYLIGTEKNKFGYDFYKNIQEFHDFMELEAERIDVQDGEIIADMGCGTGIFLENLLQHTIQRKRSLVRARLVVVDLVQEALDRTRMKYEKLLALHRDMLPSGAEFKRMNLDPNRLIPVKEFVEDSGGDLNSLRNKIEGLKNVHIDHFLQRSSRELHEILRGSLIDEEERLYLETHFDAEHRAVIRDINRAARFVRKNLFPGDFKKSKAVVSEPFYAAIRTSDLLFETLNFGDCGLSLNLPFGDNHFDKIVASLFISYLFNPEDIIKDFYRMLKPAGKVMVSSMKPDSDISVIFTNYIDKVQHFKLEDSEIKDRDINLSAARAMLNEAAALFELEEDGYFKFYSGDELHGMLERAGFKNITVHSAMGNPAQTVIAVGEKP